MAEKHTLAVLIPCLNEEKGIASVVSEYRLAFPEARVLVVDNGSTDGTANAAQAAGAEVIREARRGKARAVATALNVIDEDLVLMVDGDGTYPAEGARLLFPLCEQGMDMATGLRTPEGAQAAVFRRFHRGGSALFHAAMHFVFGYAPGDLFSGLRLFSRRFYKNVPILFRGFELETELTIQAVEKGFRVAEAPVPFRERAEGTASKLRTVRDGIRILRMILVLFRDYRPFEFFGLVSALFFTAGLSAGFLPVREYFQTHLVGRFPLAILAAALMNLAVFSLLTGVMLESGPPSSSGGVADPAPQLPGMSPESSSGPRSGVVHILSQYLWPDDAPTGIYAEQFADALARSGVTVRLVGGTGTYRPGERPAPATPIERVAHRAGKRGHLLSTALEYESVRRAFASEITRSVSPGDVVVVTSAPPTTIGLIRQIHEKGARGVYWLQDFYPELIRGVVDFPRALRRRFSTAWRERLAQWDHVVKAAGNLGYHGANARVIRNWPTLDLGESRPFRPRTALYSGNLGWGHHLPSFLALCEKLRRRGVRDHGPGRRTRSRAPAGLDPGGAGAEAARRISSALTGMPRCISSRATRPSPRPSFRPSSGTLERRAARFSSPASRAGMEEERLAAEAADYRRHLPGPRRVRRRAGPGRA